VDYRIGDITLLTFAGAIDGFRIRNATRFRIRGTMSTCRRVDQRQGRPDLPTETEGRLPIGESVAVIAGLSVFAWAILIAIVVALRALI
jgi:hypothetical protein